MSSSPPRSSAADPSSTTGFEVRVLGGFELAWGHRAVGGFESQRVRALLAYLAVHADRSFSRDQLATLLWPSEGESKARHNLRQALYSLRATLSKDPGVEASLIETTHTTVRLDPEVRVDVRTFTTAMRHARADAEPDLDTLTRAAQVYRGDFLSGFYLKDSPEFEEWLVAEQERLREDAIEALRRLVDHHLSAGGYALGIQYARKLLAIDPLSENAHRQLMRLYALSGRRSRALEDYEDLVELLARELDVEPMEETERLYRQIVDEELATEQVKEKAEPTGPVVPLAGRAEVMDTLREHWEEVARGGGLRLTLIEGEPGIGKTRLVRAVLNESSSRARTTVLEGRCYELSPLVAYEPLAEALRNGVGNEVDVAEDVLAETPMAELCDLASLVPELRELKPDLPPSRPAGPASAAELHRAYADLLRRLASGDERGDRPLILSVDNLHWADAETFDMLEALLDTLSDAPVWVVAAYCKPDPGHPLGAFLDTVAGRPDTARVLIERLGEPDVREIAAALVEGADGEALGDLLVERSQGLPLAVAEWVNLLWDEGLLVPLASGGWRLADPGALVA